MITTIKIAILKYSIGDIITRIINNLVLKKSCIVVFSLLYLIRQYEI